MALLAAGIALPNNMAWAFGPEVMALALVPRPFGNGLASLSFPIRSCTPFYVYAGHHIVL